MPHSVRLAMLVLLATGAAGILAWISRKESPVTPIASGPTLVVLSVPTTAQHDEGVLADGFSDELISSLSRVKGLRVISSASSRHAASYHFGPDQLINRLGATHVLEGNIHDSRDRLHVDLHLRALPTENVIWQFSLDRALEDIPGLVQEITRSISLSLALQFEPGNSTRTLDPELFRRYSEAKQMTRGPNRGRGIDSLRSMVAQASDNAQVHALLARLLAANIRLEPPHPGDLENATDEAGRAFQLDPGLADVRTALAILACRAAQWARCMDFFRSALEVDPSDSDCRITYAMWLVGLGYVDQALAQADVASKSDPLNDTVSFVKARLLDTAGRHVEAARYLDSLNVRSGGLVYAEWLNSVWRKDFAKAATLAANISENDGFRESYIVASEALAEPRLWSEALPLIRTSERANGRINVVRIMMPDPDYSVVISGLEQMLRNGWPSYYLLLWMPEYAALRRHPAFHGFLRSNGIIEFWRSNGWPSQCRPDGNGARC